jgi:hypothetical protein
MTHLLFLLRSADEQGQLQHGRYLLDWRNGLRAFQSLNHEAVFFRGSERAEERYSAVARLRGLRGLEDGSAFWLEIEGLYGIEPLPIEPRIDDQLIELTDDEFAALVMQTDTAVSYSRERNQTTYLAPVEIEPEPLPPPLSMETLAAVVASARRQVNFTCMLTGRVLPPDELRVAVIRPVASGGTLHVNNCLVLSPDADAAFNARQFTVRSDFSIVVDAQKISPALWSAINPTGRLLVPDNHAAPPHPDNLAYHNRAFLGLL